MAAIDAYYRKVSLLEDLAGSLYVPMMEARVRSVRGDAGENSVPSFGIYGPGATGSDVVRIMRTAVETGYTFTVAPQMEALVTAAAETLPDDDPLEAPDLPTPQGFLWIPGGLASIDVRGRVLKYNAALWTSYGGEVFVWWFTDKTDEEDMTNQELKASISPEMWSRYPLLTPNGEGRMRFGHSIPRYLGQRNVLPPEVRRAMVWNPEAGLQIAPGLTGYTPEEIREMFTPVVATDPSLKWLRSCWLLMQQSLTSLIDEPVPRNIRKLGRRAGLPTEHVTVIDLRSRPSRGDGESAVEWSHRWLVRGFWRRNQRYKDENGEWRTRAVYIHPHIKGPEGKPLVIKDHVYNLKR